MNPRSLAKQCNPVQPQTLDCIVFVIEQTIEALTHAAVIERSDLLQDGQLESEISQMLLSYLIWKSAHSSFAKIVDDIQTVKLKQ